MTISPPTDIILDVARAADPARHRQAVARLDRIAGGAGAESFDAMIGPPGDGEVSRTAGPRRREIAAGAGGATPPEAKKAYRGFEAMVLANFLSAAFPDQPSAIFGTGTAGGIWKSMLVQAMADQMARAGGIGIADQLARAESRSIAKPVSGAAGAVQTSLDPKLLVMTMERGFVSHLAEDRNSNEAAG